MTGASRIRARCPRCRREFAWEGNLHRPFCSLTRRLIDLGVWLDEGYRIPGEPFPTEAPPGDEGQRRPA